MADATQKTADHEGTALDQPRASGAVGGSSSGRQAHKGSAFRNFFKRSPSTQEGGVTPRSGTASGRGAAGNVHQASVSGEDDFDDHMNGSVYTRADICKACGFPRGSSVCCPVTRRHHGTDEVMPTGRNHSRSPSGGMSIMARIRGKLPLTPGRRANHHGSEDGDEHTPQTNELPPLSTAAQPGPHDQDPNGAGDTKETPLLRNHTMGPLNPQKDAANGEGNDNAHASLDAYGSPDSPEDEVQYFYYTDENGDTYYYTPEQQEAVLDTTQAPHQPSHLGEGDNAASPADASGTQDPNADLPSGTYVYQFVDENGQTVNCLCTPQADEGDDAAAAEGQEGEEGEGVGRATPATSAVAHAGSDSGNSSEPDEAVASKKKAPNSFFTAIQNVFKPRRDSRTVEQHEDPLSMGDSNLSGHTPQSDGNLRGSPDSHGATMQGCVETHDFDSDVAAFMELLDASEKKKFTKERKSLIKELAASEKKERESIMKNRLDGMAAFARDKLAIAFAIRKDERTIKTGQKRSEPL